MNWQTSGDENGVCVLSVQTRHDLVHIGAHTHTRHWSEKRTYHFKWFICVWVFFFFFFFLFLFFLFAFEKQIVITKLCAASLIEWIWCLSKMKKKETKGKTGHLKCVLSREYNHDCTVWTTALQKYIRSAIGWLRWLGDCSAVIVIVFISSSVVPFRKN